MQVIVRDTVNWFKYQKQPPRAKLQEFIKNHQLYDPDPQGETAYCNSIIKDVERLMPTADRTEEHRLGLHYAKQNNQSLFDIFRIILQYPEGLTYQDILNQMTREQPQSKKQSNIITVSHYCRKLLKTQFVNVRHIKEGIVVVSRLYSQGTEHRDSSCQPDEQAESEPLKDVGSTLYLKEFSLTKNILLNLSSVDAYQMGGHTKEWVCQRLDKQSERKTVSRIIQGCKLYKRQGQRKGKIYEFKFRSELEPVIQHFLESERRQPQQELIQKGALRPHIENFLREKYPDVEGDNFLLVLINTQIKQYTSSIGKKKECKRQCPPSKLMRYIWILNRLDEEVDTLTGLKAYIIEQEKDAGVGEMHKRTLLTILDDLKNLGLVTIDEELVEPTWKKLPRPSPAEVASNQLKRHAKQDISSLDNVQKKVHREAKQITEGKHAFNLFVSLLNQELDSAYLKQMRFCFRLLKTNRRKQYELESERSSLLHILTNNTTIRPVVHSKQPKDFEDVCDMIDRSVAGLCRKQDLPLKEEINPYLKRHLRCHFVGHTSEVIRRFGKGAIDKLKVLYEGSYLQLASPEQLTADSDSTYRLRLPADTFLI